MAEKAEVAIPKPPPEVEATMSRLTAHKNVKGVMILSRSSGMILRCSGSLFASTSSSSSTARNNTSSSMNISEANGHISSASLILGEKDISKGSTKSRGNEEDGDVMFGELTRKYAKVAKKLVESIEDELDGLSILEGGFNKTIGGSSGSSIVEKDNLRFLRLRTKKHELLITPDPSYILVVVQNPAA